MRLVVFTMLRNIACVRVWNQDDDDYTEEEEEEEEEEEGEDDDDDESEEEEEESEEDESDEECIHNDVHLRLNARAFGGVAGEA
eukprot:6192909-Pleurochrysis_carterae.AAC.3